jgi:CHAD domain-containing protein
MTAIRVYDELDGHARWPGLAGPIEPATEPAEVAPEETVRLALERLEVARTADVAVDDPWAEAGRKVIRFHLVRMLGHVPGVIAGEDPEAVHAMRVAGRRIRAAWRVFGDGFEVEAKRGYRRDLRAIGAHLGAVRDMDVMLEILDAYAQKRPARQRAALEPLRSAWRAERDDRHAALVALLRSTMFGRFVAEYLALATHDGLHARSYTTHEPSIVRTRMPSTIWEAYGAVWAFDGDLAAADVVTLHRLRIGAKWLRYTLEFVREPLEPESTTLVRRVVALQDHLGDIHDLHGAAMLARSFAAGSSGLGRAERTATTRLADHLDARTAGLQRGLGPTWRRLSGTSYRRGLGQAIARF